MICSCQLAAAPLLQSQAPHGVLFPLSPGMATPPSMSPLTVPHSLHQTQATRSTQSYFSLHRPMNLVPLSLSSPTLQSSLSWRHLAMNSGLTSTQFPQLGPCWVLLCRTQPTPFEDPLLLALGCQQSMLTRAVWMHAQHLRPDHSADP